MQSTSESAQGRNAQTACHRRKVNRRESYVVKPVRALAKSPLSQETLRLPSPSAALRDCRAISAKGLGAFISLNVRVSLEQEAFTSQLALTEGAPKEKSKAAADLNATKGGTRDVDTVVKRRHAVRSSAAYQGANVAGRNYVIDDHVIAGSVVYRPIEELTLSLDYMQSLHDFDVDSFVAQRNTSYNAEISYNAAKAERASTLLARLPRTRIFSRRPLRGLQSMIRGNVARAMLFDLDQAIQSLSNWLGAGDPACVRLTSNYHTLIRIWAEA
jgi:hypothetical protein